MKKPFWLGLLAGFSLFVVLFLVAIIYLIFFQVNHPSPPKVENSFVRIEEVTQINSELPAALPAPCPKETIWSALSMTGAVKPTEITKQIYANDKCFEYRFSENSSLIDVHVTMGSTLLLRQKLASGEWLFYPILSSKPTYPSRSVKLRKVTTDGRVYLEYGGWDYFGNDRPGSLLYQLHIPLHEN